MKVTVSPDAREYITTEGRYLRARHPGAARQFLDDVKKLRQALSQFPEMGRQTDEMPAPGVLRFVMGSYLVDYEVGEDDVVILKMRHGRQRPPSVEIEDDFDYEDDASRRFDGP